MKYEKIRQQVLDAILEATQLGLIHGTSGNIAVRDFEERHRHHPQRTPL